MVQMFEIEQKFIEMIRKSQQEFIDKFGMGLMEAKHNDLIKLLYELQEYKEVKGEDVQELCWTLQSENEVSKSSEKVKLQKYEEKLSSIIKELSETKLHLFYSGK